MSWVWRHSRARGNHLLVLLAIADSANDDGEDAWPTKKTLAAKTKLSVKTVQRCVQDLWEDGELLVEKNAGGTKHWREDRRPNRYTVLMHTGGQIDLPSPNGGTEEAERGDKLVERGDTADPHYIHSISSIDNPSAPSLAADGGSGAKERVDGLRAALRSRRNKEQEAS